MKTSKTIIVLSILILILAAFTTGASIVLSQPPEPESHTSVRGEEVTLYGNGLYKNDSLFSGANFRAQDLVTLILGIPLLITALFIYRRGSHRGAFFLTAMLGFFLYVYASMALMASFNNFFLIYVALFSLSLHALILLFKSLDLTELSGQMEKTMPRKGPSVFMFAGGIVTIAAWLVPIIIAQLQGELPPRLDHNTTMVTDSLDLAIITPATFISAFLMLKGRPLGYLIAMPLLGIIVMLVFLISAGTVSQILAGISFSPGEIIGPIAGFGILGVLGALVFGSIIKNLPKKAD